MVAVDPSKEMLKHLRRQSRVLGIDNIQPRPRKLAGFELRESLRGLLVEDAGELRVPLTVCTGSGDLLAGRWSLTVPR